MIKVNMADGKTLSFDLKDEKELKDWKQRCNDPKFQKSIRGVGIVHNTQWHAIPVPKKFKSVRYDADLIVNTKAKDESKRLVGEKIMCYVDDICFSLLVYYGNRPKMARIDVKKIGKQRHVGRFDENKGKQKFQEKQKQAEKGGS